MGEGRIADWIEKLEKISGTDKKIEYQDKKLEDQDTLKKLDLPIFKSLRIPLTEIYENEKLKSFFSENKGVFLRAVPSKKLIEKGLRKKFIFGNLLLSECFEFLEREIKEEKEEYMLEFSEWEESKYGWIIISNGEKIIAEISQSLDKLAHYNQTPLSSAVISFKNNKTEINWLKKEEQSAENLLKAISYLVKDKKFEKGYFEGITTTSGKNFFFDFKDNPIYYNI